MLQRHAERGCKPYSTYPLQRSRSPDAILLYTILPRAYWHLVCLSSAGAAFLHQRKTAAGCFNEYSIRFLAQCINRSTKQNSTAVAGCCSWHVAARSVALQSWNKRARDSSDRLSPTHTLFLEKRCAGGRGSKPRRADALQNGRLGKDTLVCSRNLRLPTLMRGVSMRCPFRVVNFRKGKQAAFHDGTHPAKRRTHGKSH